jgi:hypothetical protein
VFQDGHTLSDISSSVPTGHLLSGYSHQPGSESHKNPENPKSLDPVDLVNPVDLSSTRAPPVGLHHRDLLGHHHGQDNREYIHPRLVYDLEF